MFALVTAIVYEEWRHLHGVANSCMEWTTAARIYQLGLESGH